MTFFILIFLLVKYTNYCEKHNLLLDDPPTKEEELCALAASLD